MPDIYYAFIEETDNANIITFDCALISLMDQALIRFADNSEQDFMSEVQTAFISIQSENLSQAYSIEEITGRWLRLSISYEKADNTPAVNIQQERSEEMQEAFLNNLEVLQGETASQLDQLSSLNWIEDSTEEVISTLLDTPRFKFGFVSVYDVGQGNCNAICDSKGMPCVYYDFGYPLFFNSSGTPTPFPTFCFTYNPPIILSHWDYDHYAAALVNRSPSKNSALKAHWIAPKQFASAKALELISALNSKGLLHLWPTNLERIKTWFGEITKCSGPDNGNANEKNDSGLALIASPYPCPHAILLPGDADYCYVNVPDEYELVGLVASHHGGNVSNLPRAERTTNKLAFSVGNDNSYGHPSPQAIIEYASKGWNHMYFTSSRPAGKLGNIAISIHSNRYVPRTTPCGNHCSLYITQ